MVSLQHLTYMIISYIHIHCLFSSISFQQKIISIVKAASSLETHPRTEAITEDHKFIAADFIVINKIEGGDVYERVFI